MAVVLYGADYSVYARIVRLVLTEKGVAYTLSPVDIFVDDGPPPGYLEKHPFGKIPTFDHDGFSLHETTAITRYIDAAFGGPALQPRDIRQRARMDQIISIGDSYMYRPMVWDLYVERVEKPSRGEAPDETRIALALERSTISLRVLSYLMADGPWLAGQDISLADLHLAPMIDYFQMTPEGLALLDRFPKLSAWWEKVSARPSMMGTRYPR